MPELRYLPDEIARLGDAIYDRDVLPRMTPADTGLIVAIDVETGAYAIDPDKLTAIHRVLDLRPDAQIWIKRVGLAYVQRSGWGRSRRMAATDNDGCRQPLRRNDGRSDDSWPGRSLSDPVPE